MIDELIKWKQQCEQSMWAARKAAAEVETAIGAVLTVPCERYEDAENKMRNAIEASVATRLRAGENARILRERAIETSAAIADGSIAANEAAKACFIAVEAAVSAGVAEMEARECWRAEMRAHEAVRDRMQDRKGRVK